MNTTQAAPADSKAPSFGKKLQTAREAQKITRKEAAQRIRLSEKVIIMLEKDFYSDDIPTAFIRGYLAIYAKFLELPDSEVKSQLAHITPKPIINHGQPLTVHNNPVARHTHLFVQLFSILIICTLVGLVGTWWYTQQKQATFVPAKTHKKDLTQTQQIPAALASQTSQQPVLATQNPTPAQQPTIIVESNDHQFTASNDDSSGMATVAANTDKETPAAAKPIQTAENTATNKPIAQNAKKPRYVAIDPYTYAPQ